MKKIDEWQLDCYTRHDHVVPLFSYYAEDMATVWQDIKNTLGKDEVRYGIEKTGITKVKLHFPYGGKCIDLYSMDEAREKLKLYLTFA